MTQGRCTYSRIAAWSDSGSTKDSRTLLHPLHLIALDARIRNIPESIASTVSKARPNVLVIGNSKVLIRYASFSERHEVIIRSENRELTATRDHRPRYGKVEDRVKLRPR